MKITKITISLLLSALLNACLPISNTLTSNATGSTECLEELLDGNLRLRSWGNGSKKAEAIQNAQKNAINDLLFKGIRLGNTSCSIPPILPGPNERERKAAFFESFFKTGGDYKNYVQTEKVISLYRVVGSKQIVAKSQLLVNLSKLRQDFQKTSAK